MTARETMLPETANRAGWTLDHANSVYEAIFNLAYIVGPGIGGLLIATLGGVNTMWVTAGAFVLSICSIGILRLEGAGTPDRAVRAGGVRVVPEVLHRPRRAGTAGLGPDGAEYRRARRRAGLRSHIEVHAQANRHADRRSHPRRGHDRHRLPAAAAGDPPTVCCGRLRLRADCADLQLRHADPRAPAPAWPSRRGDGIAGLRRGTTGSDPGRWV